MMRFIVYLIASFALLLSSCSQATVQITSTRQPTGHLTPYQTVTPSPVRPTATLEISIPVTPTPTATPFLYTVKKDDTMLGIAYQFGITLDALQAANPTVDPHFMGEGLQLIIPMAEETPQFLPTPTLITLDIREHVCYRSGDGGAWCIAAVQDELETSVENISVWIGLFDTQGNNFTSQTAYGPLNILQPGASMPLLAYFPPPLPDQFQAHAKMTGALSVSPDDERYIDAQVSIDTTDVSSDGMQMTVIGKVNLPDGSPKVSQLWILAVGYDVEGNIVGVRKWKSDGELSFEIPVYSLAGAIDRVETLVEARP